MPFDRFVRGADAVIDDCCVIDQFVISNVRGIRWLPSRLYDNEGVVDMIKAPPTLRVSVAVLYV